MRVSLGQPVKTRDWKVKKSLDLPTTSGVASRIQRFRDLAVPKAKHELSNTGKTNRAKREIFGYKESEEEIYHSTADPHAYTRNKVIKAQAITTIQAMFRGQQARKRVAVMGFQSATSRKKRRAIVKMQAVVRAKQARDKLKKLQAQRDLENRRALEKERMNAETRAAIKMQAVVRSALTRMRVNRMVEKLIEDMIRNDEQTRAAIKMQAFVRSALTRMRVAQTVEDLIAVMMEQQQKDEDAHKVALLAAQEAARKEEEEAKVAEEARLKALMDDKARPRQKRMGGPFEPFEGPLQDAVDRIPAWWMDYTPHTTLHMDDFVDLEEDWCKERKDKLQKKGLAW